MPLSVILSLRLNSLAGEPDACAETQAESYTTPSRGIEGKAGRLGVADPSPGNNIPVHLLFCYDQKALSV